MKEFLNYFVDIPHRNILQWSELWISFWYDKISQCDFLVLTHWNKAHGKTPG